MQCDVFLKTVAIILDHVERAECFPLLHSSSHQVLSSPGRRGFESLGIFLAGAWWIVTANLGLRPRSALSLECLWKAPHYSAFFFFFSILKEYQKLFPDIPIGYSGHETGIAISVAAVALGAKVLERHITLDKTWKGSDHSASLEPGELAELVRSVRLVEKALGSPTKQLLPCEMACNEKVGSDPARCFCWEGLQWACLRGGL